jgi:hypothetical protein
LCRGGCRGSLDPLGVDLDNAAVSAQEIDEYLAALDEPKRGTLSQLRATIVSIVPDAEQGMSYRLPAFRLRGKAIAGSRLSRTISATCLTVAL